MMGELNAELSPGDVGNVTTKEDSSAEEKSSSHERRTVSADADEGAMPSSNEGKKDSPHGTLDPSPAQLQQGLKTHQKSISEADQALGSCSPGQVSLPPADLGANTKELSKSKIKKETVGQLQPEEQKGAVVAQPEQPLPSSFQTLEDRLRTTEHPSVTPADIHGPQRQPTVSDINDFAPVPASSSGELSGPPKVITTSVAVSVRSPSPRSGSSSKNKPTEALRRGKWTVEEEAYVARVIQDFNSGFLDAPAATTLRTYLSEKLQCDPMRITKKFTGDACIGKRVFHPAVRSPSNASAIDKAQAELRALEQRWRRRLEMQQRESAKKAAASAAAAAASGRGYGRGSANSTGKAQQNVVAQTASWLDRAKTVLKEPALDSSTQEQDGDLQNQMQEVQRLIYEGPIIQQTSAGLPNMLDHAEQQAATASDQDAEPADKRMRTAEDAEALVGFLRSVRASAASGENF